MIQKSLILSNHDCALRPTWDLIPESAVLEMQKSNVLNVSTRRHEVIAQILAAMTTKFAISFKEPEIWFTIKPGVELTRNKKKYLDSIKPVPAKWRHIVIVFKPNPKLLWIARDKNNVTHYQYAQSWVEHREHAKTIRVLSQFDDFALQLNRAISTSSPQDSLALRVMRACPIRVGSGLSKTYGLTTLRAGHLKGKKITFVGKSNVVNTCDLETKQA